MGGIRVLHCPDGIAGNPQALARAEREVGLESRSVVLAPHRFGYNPDQVLTNGSRLAMEWHRWTLYRMARDWADVVHFNFGSTTMPQRVDPGTGREAWLRRMYNVYAGALEQKDLDWLARRGRPMMVTFQGNDARQGDVASRSRIHPVTEAAYYSSRTDAWKRRRIARFARRCDRIYALNPDLLHVLPEEAEFLPYASVDMQDWPFSPAPASDEGPLVVHAPSHRGVKGTRHVLAAVERLRAEGVPFRFRLVEGLPLLQARQLYAQADLVVDQLLAGWYGGLAVECMALGKPVVCYIRDEDLHFIPDRMRDALPLIRAEPENVVDVLRVWLTDRREEMTRRGQASRRFVKEWHDPVRIAQRLKGDYEEALGRGG